MPAPTTHTSAVVSSHRTGCVGTSAVAIQTEVVMPESVFIGQDSFGETYCASRAEEQSKRHARALSLSQDAATKSGSVSLEKGIATPDGSKLYVAVGSNSNVGENGIEKEVAIAEGPSGAIAAWETAGEERFARVGADGPSASRRSAPRATLATVSTRRWPSTGPGISCWCGIEGTAWARGGSLAWRLFGPDGRALAESGERTDLPA